VLSLRTGGRKNIEDITAFATIRYPPRKNITVQEMKRTIENTHKIVDFTMAKLKQLGYNSALQPVNENIKKMIEAVSAVQKQ